MLGHQPDSGSIAGTNCLSSLRLRSSQGSALLAALAVTGILGILGFVFLGKITNEQRHTGHWRQGTQAFYLAEAAVNKSLSLIREGSVSQYPYVENNVQFGKGQYTLTLDKVQGGQGAYATDFYTLRGVGEVEGVRRGVEVGLREDTFLRFSRFVEDSSLYYGRYAVLSGEVWAGYDLNLNHYPVTFMRDARAAHHINNPGNGIFHGAAVENAPPIDLHTSVDLNFYKDLAQGNLPDAGQGMYAGSSSSIDLRLFDFSGSTPKYNGSSLGSDFNGVIYVNGDAYVEGELHGRSLTIIASDDIIITDQVRTGGDGHNYTKTNPPVTFNSAQGVEQVAEVNIDSLMSIDTPVVKIRTSGKKWNSIKGELLEDGAVVSTTYLTRQPGSPNEQMATFSNFTPDPASHSYVVRMHYKSSGNGANPTWIRVYQGDPVNLGLVAKDKVYIDSYAPRELVIDAALLARDRNWVALGDSSSHPTAYDGSWDLTINGPIITNSGGSAGPWSSYGTRHYNYDEDIVEHQPPYFPVPFGGWQKVYWKELLPRDLS